MKEVSKEFSTNGPRALLQEYRKSKRIFGRIKKQL
jgi:hypothetical protein